MSIKSKVKKEDKNFKLNGRDLSSTMDQITYSNVCAMANLSTEQNPSITYKYGNESGILCHDERLELVEGLIINAHVTGNS